MKHVPFSAGALLLAAAATAMGQAPVIDGTKDAVYGSPLWVNTSNPTGYGDNAAGFYPCNDFGSGIQIAINNSNTGGVTGVANGGPGVCMEVFAGVTTGLEFKIPFAAIGNPTATTFKIAGFIINGGHDTLSNQVIGGSTTCLANLLEPRTTSFDDADAGGIPGNQYVTVTNTIGDPTVGPTLDGTLESGFYGAPLWTNNTETGFGDATTGVPGNCDGNEIDHVFARVTGSGADKALYIFVAGNLKTTFDKIWIFLDCIDGEGQNQLRGDNANIDFNGLNRLGDNTGGGNGPGLKFDAGVAPDFCITATNGNNPAATFANFATLPTLGGGQGNYLGTALNPAAVTVASCTGNQVPLPVPSPNLSFGSEIDAAYGIACGDFLHVFIAGNLETNGNRMNFFFDVDNTTANEGQQTIGLNNVTVGFDAVNSKLGGPANEGDGLRFDAGFKADYWVAVRNTGSNEMDGIIYAEAAFLRTNGAQKDPFGAFLDYGSFTQNVKSIATPLSFDGTHCIRTVFNETTMMDECMPFGSGSAWNPTSVVGIDVQADAQYFAFNSLTPQMALDIFASFAPRLISPTISYDSMSNTGIAGAYDPLGQNIFVPGQANLTQPGLIQANIDNSNIAGVTGDTASGGESVTTGVELKIRLDELGWDGVSPIRMVAFIANGDNAQISNQIVGGLPPGTGNFGESRTVNFDESYTNVNNNPMMLPGFTGQQFVTIPVVNGPCVVTPTTGACCCGSHCSVTTSAACPTGAGTNSTWSAGGVCTPYSNTVPCCRGDYNKSGGNPSVQDIFDFLAGYFGTNACADANDSGGNPSVQDIFDFLAAYFGGC